MGDCIGIDSDGDTLFMSGYVLDPDGKPIDNALIEVWQSNSKGLYDIQDPNQQEGNFRGCFQTDASGKYAFETVVPISYNIQGDGPSVEMLRHLGRHQRRSAHIHFKLSAAGFTSLTTQISPNNDDYLESDTTFSVMDTNIMELQKQQASDEEACEDKKPFYTTKFNFVLSPIVEA